MDITPPILGIAETFFAGIGFLPTVTEGSALEIGTEVCCLFSSISEDFFGASSLLTSLFFLLALVPIDLIS